MSESIVRYHNALSPATCNTTSEPASQSCSLLVDAHLSGGETPDMPVRITGALIRSQTLEGHFAMLDHLYDDPTWQHRLRCAAQLGATACPVDVRIRDWISPLGNTPYVNMVAAIEEIDQQPATSASSQQLRAVRDTLILSAAETLIGAANYPAAKTVIMGEVVLHTQNTTSKQMFRRRGLDNLQDTLAQLELPWA